MQTSALLSSDSCRRFSSCTVTGTTLEWPPSSIFPSTRTLPSILPWSSTQPGAPIQHRCEKDSSKHFLHVTNSFLLPSTINSFAVFRNLILKYFFHLSFPITTSLLQLVQFSSVSRLNRVIIYPFLSHPPSNRASTKASS